MWQFLAKYQDFGLLVMRMGLGTMFVLHGLPKLTGGPDTWHNLGNATSYVGVTFMPTLFGFLAAASEFGGGICIVLGIAFRPACVALCSTMVVASAMHLGKGDSLVKGASHAVELAFVFFGLAMVGPGKHAVKP